MRLRCGQPEREEETGRQISQHSSQRPGLSLRWDPSGIEWGAGLTGGEQECSSASFRVLHKARLRAELTIPVSKDPVSTGGEFESLSSVKTECPQAGNREWRAEENIRMKAGIRQVPGWFCNHRVSHSFSQGRHPLCHITGLCLVS